MRIRILKRKETPTHSLVQGMTVDLKEKEAKILILAGYAKKVEKKVKKQIKKGERDG